MDNQQILHYSRSDWPSRLVLTALVLGILLSIASWLHLCSGACAASHTYRLYDIPFEPIGIAFFAAAAFAYGRRQSSNSFNLLTAVLLATAVGSELFFIYAQKYIIGKWCPLCLTIASCVLVAFLIDGWQRQRATQNILDCNNKRKKSMFQLLRTSAFIAFGFIFALQGFSQFDALHAAEKSLKEQVAFGSSSAPIEVYVFTDWECSACHKIEPAIEALAPEITKDNKLIFVDYTIHEESMNFTPFNLSFMINNKPQYLKLRQMLTQLSLSDDAPTEGQIEEGAKALGVQYKQLNYADVNKLVEYFKALGTEFNIEGTPTVVVANSLTKKGKVLAGVSEITPANIREAIKNLQ
jgi:protein-disulfide isomerase/uncharacterized membrane protein